MESALQITRDRLEEARMALARATGGQALCRVDDDGTTRRLEVKRLEGATIALADARDALRLAGDAPDPLAAEVRWWGEELESHRARGMGPEWIAYAEGGLAALRALRDEIGQPS